MPDAIRIIDEDYNIILYNKAYAAIQKVRSKGKTAFTDACIRLVHEKYNKDKNFEEYVNLYDSLMNR